MKSNILIILGCIFALSMVGRSFALNSAGLNDTTQATKPAAEQQARDDPGATGDTDDMLITGAMLESFKERRQTIEKREQELAERERTLQAVEKRIEERMSALDASNQQLADKMALLQKTANEDITHLTSMYQSMKPQQASEIFNQMDSVFAAGFLREMKSDQAGLILANMNPDKAYEISIIIASKNSDLRPKIQ